MPIRDLLSPSTRKLSPEGKRAILSLCVSPYVSVVALSLFRDRCYFQTGYIVDVRSIASSRYIVSSCDIISEESVCHFYYRLSVMTHLSRYITSKLCRRSMTVQARPLVAAFYFTSIALYGYSVASNNPFFVVFQGSNEIINC